MHDPEGTKGDLVAHLRVVHRLHPQHIKIEHWSKQVLVELHRDFHRRDGSSRGD